MKINIENLNLKGFSKIEYIKDNMFMVTNPCPICHTDDNIKILSSIQGKKTKSLEVGFCKSCEHRFLRKSPSLEWFDSFYKNIFDTGDVRKKTTLLSSIKEMLMNYPIAWKIFEELKFLKSKLTHKPINHHQIHSMTFLIGVMDTDYTFLFPDDSLKNVLEIGCGYGGMLSSFKRQGYNVSGVEASKERAKYCKIRGLDVYCDGDEDNYSKLAQKDKFDFVYSLHAFEHIPNPDFHMKKISNMVREGGWIYIQVPHYNIHSEHNFIYQAHQIDHCNTFSLKSLNKLLVNNGFIPKRLRIDDSIYLLARKEKITENTYSCYSQSILNTFIPDIEAKNIFKENHNKSLSIRWGSNNPFKIYDENNNILYERQTTFNEINNVLVNEPPSSITINVKDTKDTFPVYINHDMDYAPLFFTHK